MVIFGNLTAWNLTVKTVIFFTVLAQIDKGQLMIFTAECWYIPSDELHNVS